MFPCFAPDNRQAVGLHKILKRGDKHHENKLSEKVHYLLLCSCLAAHHFCSRDSKSGLPCTTRYYVGCSEPYRLVADIFTFDWLEAFPARGNKARFCEKVLFRNDQTAVIGTFLCPCVWDQFTCALYLFPHRGKNRDLLHRLWDSAACSQRLSVVYFWPDGRGVRLAWVYAGRI